jgi:glycosyl transferase family 87
MRIPFVSGDRGVTRLDQLLLVALLATVVVVTIQRGVTGHAHTTFAIFRQSYVHLVTSRDLYARYPAEQGASADDLFKYSPTAALLFAPFALLPYVVALFLWELLNAGSVYLAIHRLLPPRLATMTLILAYPELLRGLQAISSNPLIAALMVFTFLEMERERRVRAALVAAIGTLIKIFPLAGLALAVFHDHKRRFAFVFIAVLLVLVALPLLVTPPAALLAQYASWRSIERLDALNLGFGDSVMAVLRRVSGASFPNWPVQLAGTVILLLPIALRRDRWPDLSYRRGLLYSLLVYVVLFNHQTESATFAIAGVGVAAWYVTSEKGVLRTALLVLCLAGLKTIPYTIVWVVMQRELLGPGLIAAVVPASEGEVAAPEPGLQPG